MRISDGTGAGRYRPGVHGLEGRALPLWGARRFVVASLVLLAGCELLEREPLALPTAEAAAGYFEQHPGVRSVELNGNVVEVYVEQPLDQLVRGGALWARVGPYVYLFTSGTRDLMDAYGGVAGVRVVTRTPGHVEVARAMLRRDDLSDIQWRRGQGLLGAALRNGTERPTQLERLVQWAEDHTDYRYNPDYVPPR